MDKIKKNLQKVTFSQSYGKIRAHLARFPKSKWNLLIGDIVNAPSEFIPTICNFCIFIDGSWDFYTSFCTSMFWTMFGLCMKFNRNWNEMKNRAGGNGESWRGGGVNGSAGPEIYSYTWLLSEKVNRQSYCLLGWNHINLPSC